MSPVNGLRSLSGRLPTRPRSGEYLIDASAYWRIDRGSVLAVAWRDHLERGLVWICPPAELEICRRASKDQHAVHLREFTDTYVRVELHHQAGTTAREIQT